MPIKICLVFLLSFTSIFTWASETEKLLDCPSVTIRYAVSDQNSNEVKYEIKTYSLTANELISIENDDNKNVFVEKIKRDRIPINGNTEVVAKNDCSPQKLEEITKALTEANPKVDCPDCDEADKVIPGAAEILDKLQEEESKACPKKISKKFVLSCLKTNPINCVSNVALGILKSILNLGEFLYDGVGWLSKKTVELTVDKLGVSIDGKPISAYVDKSFKGLKKGGKKFFKAPIKFIKNWHKETEKIEDETAENMDFIGDNPELIENALNQVKEDKDGFLKRVTQNIWLASVKAYGCKKWAGLPLVSKCEKKADVKCMDCSDYAQVGCGMVGYLMGEIPSAFLLGFAIGAPLKVLKNVKAVAYVDKAKVSYRATSLGKSGLGLKIVENLEIAAKALKTFLESTGAKFTEIRHGAKAKAEGVVNTLGNLTSNIQPNKWVEKFRMQLTSLPSWYIGQLDRAFSAGLKSGSAGPNAVYGFQTARKEMLVTSAKELKMSLRATNQALKELGDVPEHNRQYIKLKLKKRELGVKLISTRNLIKIVDAKIIAATDMYKVTAMIDDGIEETKNMYESYKQNILDDKTLNPKQKRRKLDDLAKQAKQHGDSFAAKNLDAVYQIYRNKDKGPDVLGDVMHEAWKIGQKAKSNDDFYKWANQMEQIKDGLPPSLKSYIENQISNIKSGNFPENIPQLKPVNVNSKPEGFAALSEEKKLGVTSEWDTGIVDIANTNYADLPKYWQNENKYTAQQVLNDINDLNLTGQNSKFIETMQKNASADLNDAVKYLNQNRSRSFIRDPLYNPINDPAYIAAGRERYRWGARHVYVIDSSGPSILMYEGVRGVKEGEDASSSVNATKIEEESKEKAN